MSAILTGTYDPSRVIVTIGGVIITGFSDGDSIIARRAEDMYFTRVGTDGGVARARNANKMGEIEIKLLQTSAVNDSLSSLLAIDDLVNDGLPVLSITIVDGSGRSLVVATQCWIKTIPEVILGKEVSERAWIFSAADLKIFHGGNNV
jgi:hypothetical protein